MSRNMQEKQLNFIATSMKLHLNVQRQRDYTPSTELLPPKYDYVRAAMMVSIRQFVTSLVDIRHVMAGTRSRAPHT